jgi:hypothetical protein
MRNVSEPKVIFGHSMMGKVLRFANPTYWTDSLEN